MVPSDMTQIAFVICEALSNSLDFSLKQKCPFWYGQYGLLTNAISLDYHIPMIVINYHMMEDIQAWVCIRGQLNDSRKYLWTWVCKRAMLLAWATVTYLMSWELQSLRCGINSLFVIAFFGAPYFFGLSNHSRGM